MAATYNYFHDQRFGAQNLLIRLPDEGLITEVY